MNTATEEYNYNPSVTELRQAYEIAYGDDGVYMLVGIMFANLSQPVIERLYQQVIAQVRLDLVEKGLA